MSIFSLFKKEAKTGRDSIIDSTELIGESAVESGEAPQVVTSLSISPEWNLAKEQEYVLKFLSNDLQPLKPNQLSLAGIGIEKEISTGDWHVQAFMRSSLDRPITLGKAELLVLDGDQNPVASQEFDLSLLGALPPQSDRPWIFTFDKKNIKSEDPSALEWTLAFNVQSLVPHSLDLEESWAQALSPEQKTALENAVKNLPALKPREVNIVGFQSKFTENGDFAVSVFIRNGHTRHINLEQAPLEILDANGQLVSKGSFKLDGFTVKANTTRPWTFIFPKKLLLIENPDLSRWTARFAK